jgi:AcrR family transcriptional regulator
LQGTTRRNPRAERTRAALITAGRRLFSSHPVDAVTIDDIVQAAGVGKGSFYNHFDGRDALLRAVSAEIRASVERTVGRVNAGIADPGLRMGRAICTYLRYALDDPERAGVLARINYGQTSLASPLNQGLVEDVSAGLASGRFSVPTVEAAVLFVVGVTQVALARLREDRTDSFAVALSQQLCALVLRGLGMSVAESDLIAAQASDEIVRQGAFAIPRR